MTQDGLLLVSGWDGSREVPKAASESRRASKSPVRQRPRAGLRDPRRLERLIDIPSLAPNRVGDLRGSHAFPAQGDDSRVIERD